MSILAVQMNPIVGDLLGNTKKIIFEIEEGKKRGAELIVFPEMALTGYPPEDLLLDATFIQEAEDKLKEILLHTLGVTVVVGGVRKNLKPQEKSLFNTAAILQNGKLVGFQDKRLLPTYDVFDEKRYFEPGNQTFLWKSASFSFSVLICEDMWQHGGFVRETHYKEDPVEDVMKHQPDLILNISASPYHFQKRELRLAVCQSVVRSVKKPLLFVCQVGGNDQLIFDGYSLFLNAKAEVVAQGKGFVEDLLLIDLKEEKRSCLFAPDPLSDLYSALVLGVRDYFFKQGFKKACLGLSGGIDSALVAVIAQEALGSENVTCVQMPSRFTAPSSQTDAQALAKNLHLELLSIPIEDPFTCFLALLEPVFAGASLDVTEENIQARIRGLILMALANKKGYLVLSTGNKSELAMGYCTLYGDMCGGLNVISDLSKTKVYALAQWINEKRHLIPESILKKEPTAELKTNQKDSDTLPDYALLDPIIEAYVERQLPVEEIAKHSPLSLSEIQKIIHIIHLAEYKRRQAAPGLRVSPKSFQVGRRVPVVQKGH